MCEKRTSCGAYNAHVGIKTIVPQCTANVADGSFTIEPSRAHADQCPLWRNGLEVNDHLSRSITDYLCKKAVGISRIISAPGDMLIRANDHYVALIEVTRVGIGNIKNLEWNILACRRIHHRRSV